MPQLDIIRYTLVLGIVLVLLTIVFIFAQFTSSLKYAYDEAYLIFKDFCALLENYIFSKFECGLRGLKSYLVFLFLDQKSARLNSSHVRISYAVFCLKKNTKIQYNN